MQWLCISSVSCKSIYILIFYVELYGAAEVLYIYADYFLLITNIVKKNNQTNFLSSSSKNLFLRFRLDINSSV